MFECPSRLKQWGATCLIQTRRNLRVTVYVETAAPLPFAHPHCSFFHSRNNHTPPFLAYSQCKSPAGSLVYNTAGKRKCHLGTPPFLRHSLSSSHVVHAVLVSLESDEQNFTLARASYYLLLGKKPTHRARCCHRPVPYTSHSVWPAHLHCENMTRDEWTLGHEHVCLCVARRSRRGSWGIQSLTQRSRDRRADTFQAWYNPSGIHEWNDRITGVLENLLRWLIMLFMVGRHTARREKSNCLTNENMDKLFTHRHQTANLRREVFLSISTHGLVLTSINADTWKFESVVLLQTDLLK